MAKNVFNINLEDDNSEIDNKFAAGSLFRAHQQSKLSVQPSTSKQDPHHQQVKPTEQKQTSMQTSLAPRPASSSGQMTSEQASLAPRPTFSGGQITKSSSDGSSGQESSILHSDPHQTFPPAMVTVKPAGDETKKTEDQTNEQPAASAPPVIPNSTTSIIVNARQRGNPILKFIRNVPWEFGDIVPDYHLGKATCALFLSLRYHQLKPDYIHNRLRQLGRSYDLRVLLVQVDVKDPHHSIKDLAQMCMLADCTLILAFSPEEAGRYLETYKAYENKPPDLIMEKTDKNPLTQFSDCITSIKKLNKTDASTLLTTFKSFEGVTKASEDDLAACTGFGPQKAKRLHTVLHEPFLKVNKAKPAASSKSAAATLQVPGPTEVSGK